MAYCGPLGLPHSKFLKWKPEDRAKALAFKLEEASICQMCGTAEWQWAENKYAFEPQEKFCMGCYLKDTTSEKEDTLPGTSVVLIPAEEAKRIRSLRKDPEEVKT